MVDTLNYCVFFCWIKLIRWHKNASLLILRKRCPKGFCEWIGLNSPLPIGYPNIIHAIVRSVCKWARAHRFVPNVTQMVNTSMGSRCATDTNCVCLSHRCQLHGSKIISDMRWSTHTEHVIRRKGDKNQINLITSPDDDGGGATETPTQTQTTQTTPLT